MPLRGLLPSGGGCRSPWQDARSPPSSYLRARPLTCCPTTCLPPATQACDHLGKHQRAIHQYVARSSAAVDRTLANGPALSLLPAPRIAALPRSLGGLGVPDLGSQNASLAAKKVVHALAPGPLAWKAVLHHQLATAAPHPN